MHSAQKMRALDPHGHMWKSASPSVMLKGSMGPVEPILRLELNREKNQIYLKTPAKLKWPRIPVKGAAARFSAMVPKDHKFTGRDVLKVAHITAGVLQMDYLPAGWVLEANEENTILDLAPVTGKKELQPFYRLKSGYNPSNKDTHRALQYTHVESTIRGPDIAMSALENSWHWLTSCAPFVASTTTFETSAIALVSS